MRRAGILTLFCVGVGAALWFGILRPEPRPDTGLPDQTASPAVDRSKVTVAESLAPSSPMTPPSETAPLIGETLLAGYADPEQLPRHDLTLMSRLMDNFLLLVKEAADRPLSANEDWANALRGVNPAQERFLPEDHVALNKAGQLVDRWGTPLFFHALGDRRFEIRSAGPDRELWTEDDIQLNADGSFGEAG